MRGIMSFSPQRLLGVYGDPRVVSLLFFGFSSGLPLALTGATLAVWLTEAGVNLTNIGLVSLVGLAYAFKFLWSPLVDRLPIPGLTTLFGRRRSWMLTSQCAIVAAALRRSDQPDRPGLDEGAARPKRVADREGWGRGTLGSGPETDPDRVASGVEGESDRCVWGVDFAAGRVAAGLVGNVLDTAPRERPAVGADQFDLAHVGAVADRELHLAVLRQGEDVHPVLLLVV